MGQDGGGGFVDEIRCFSGIFHADPESKSEPEAFARFGFAET